MTENRSLVRIFRIPAWVNLLAFLGLVTALFGSGAWDVAAWLGLGTSVIAILWAVSRR